MKSRRVASQFIACSLGIAIFTQCAFAHRPQSNLWEDRRSSLSQKEPLQERFAASLPAQSMGQKTAASDSLEIPGERLRHLLTALPVEYGTVRAVHAPAGDPVPESFVLVHIHDVHREPEAQRNISKALSRLVHEHAVGMVGLEGTAGALNLTEFNAFPHPEVVRDVANYFLRENRISGAIHAALSDRLTVPFVGIDHERHYQNNIAAYMRSETRRASALRELHRWESDLARRRRSLTNRRLAEFDRRAEAYDEGRIGLAEYLPDLEMESALPEGGNLRRFLRASKLESNLDSHAVERDRRELLHALSSRLTPLQTRALIRLAADIRSGNVTRRDIYREIKNLCDQANLSLRAYPAMEQYLRYISEVSQMDAEKLYQELRVAERTAYERLANGDEDRRFSKAAGRFRLTKKLLFFSLSSEDWEAYKSLDPREVDAGNMPAEMVEPFETFYREAEHRDRAMAEQLLHHMRKHGAKSAALITGGFHAKGIRRWMSSANVLVVDFVPKITQIRSGGAADYLSVFAQEKAPLDKLFEGQRLFLSEAPASQGTLFWGRILILLTAIKAGFGSLWKLREHFPSLRKWSLIAATGTNMSESMVAIPPKNMGPLGSFKISARFDSKSRLAESTVVETSTFRETIHRWIGAAGPAGTRAQLVGAGTWLWVAAITILSVFGSEAIASMDLNPAGRAAMLDTKSNSVAWTLAFLLPAVVLWIYWLGRSWRLFGSGRVKAIHINDAPGEEVRTWILKHIASSYSADTANLIVKKVLDARKIRFHNAPDFVHRLGYSIPNVSHLMWASLVEGMSFSPPFSRRKALILVGIVAMPIWLPAVWRRVERWMSTSQVMWHYDSGDAESEARLARQIESVYELYGNQDIIVVLSQRMRWQDISLLEVGLASRLTDPANLESAEVQMRIAGFLDKMRGSPLRTISSIRDIMARGTTVPARFPPHLVALASRPKIGVVVEEQSPKSLSLEVRAAFAQKRAKEALYVKKDIEEFKLQLLEYYQSRRSSLSDDEQSVAAMVRELRGRNPQAVILVSRHVPEPQAPRLLSGTNNVEGTVTTISSPGQPAVFHAARPFAEKIDGSRGWPEEVAPELLGHFPLTTLFYALQASGINGGRAEKAMDIVRQHMTAQDFEDLNAFLQRKAPLIHAEASLREDTADWVMYSALSWFRVNGFLDLTMQVGEQSRTVDSLLDPMFQEDRIPLNFREEKGPTPQPSRIGPVQLQDIEQRNHSLRTNRRQFFRRWRSVFINVVGLGLFFTAALTVPSARANPRAADSIQPTPALQEWSAEDLERSLGQEPTVMGVARIGEHVGSFLDSFAVDARQKIKHRTMNGGSATIDNSLVRRHALIQQNFITAAIESDGSSGVAVVNDGKPGAALVFVPFPDAWMSELSSRWASARSWLSEHPSVRPVFVVQSAEMDRRLRALAFREGMPVFTVMDETVFTQTEEFSSAVNLEAFDELIVRGEFEHQATALGFFQWADLPLYYSDRARTSARIQQLFFVLFSPEFGSAFTTADRMNDLCRQARLLARQA